MCFPTGIEFLERLIELDAADNCIAEHKRLNVLATLHHLTNVCMIVYFDYFVCVVYTACVNWKPNIRTLILP